MASTLTTLRLRRAILFLALVSTPLAVPTRAAAQFRALHDFGEVRPAPIPTALIQGSDGNLYGTLFEGFAGGAVFQLSPDTQGHLTRYLELHRFLDPGPFASSDPGGGAPVGLIEASDGSLYGTTAWGGDGDSGTVFQLSRDGGSGAFTVHTVLHRFGWDDGLPWAGVIEGPAGALYGTTITGAVFELAKDDAGQPTVYSVLHRVTGDEGWMSVAPLLLGSDGRLYGTTEGGQMAGGVAFSLSRDADGRFTLFDVLHVFGIEDGYRLESPLLEAFDGKLYGTTFAGGGPAVGWWTGGTVYALSRDAAGAFTVHRTVHAFLGGPDDGQYPIAGLVERGGKLYGSTVLGGAWGTGTVYELAWSDAAGAFADLTIQRHLGAFLGDDHAAPGGGLAVGRDGTLYGASGWLWLDFACAPHMCRGYETHSTGRIFSLVPQSIPSTLAWAGDTKAYRGRDLTARARLVGAAGGAPAAGEPIEFRGCGSAADGSIACEACLATTDATGTASCSMAVPDAPGLDHLEVISSYGGSSTLMLRGTQSAATLLVHDQPTPAPSSSGGCGSGGGAGLPALLGLVGLLRRRRPRDRRQGAAAHLVL